MHTWLRSEREPERRLSADAYTLFVCLHQESPFRYLSLLARAVERHGRHSAEGTWIGYPPVQDADRPLRLEIMREDRADDLEANVV